MKWIANIDKFSQLKKEHEKCKAVRAELEIKLRHVTQLLLNEKQICRNAELERDYFVSIFQMFGMYLYLQRFSPMLRSFHILLI